MSPYPASSTRARLSRHLRHAFNPHMAPVASTASFAHPLGVGVIGPNADDFLRTALVEALTSPGELSIVSTWADLNRMLGTDLGSTLVEAFAARLRLFDLLEETIEHLELVADTVRTNSAPGGVKPTAVWFATPGADADVVQQTVDRWAGLNLTPWLSGPWAYGPTHYFDISAPRPVYAETPLKLFTHEEAFLQLQPKGQPHRIDTCERRCNAR